MTGYSAWALLETGTWMVLASGFAYPGKAWQWLQARENREDELAYEVLRAGLDPEESAACQCSYLNVFPPDQWGEGESRDRD